MFARPRFLLALVALMLVAVACSKSAAPKESSSPDVRPSSTAVLAIDAPRNGAVLKGPSVPVSVTLSGGTIVPLASKDLSPDKGHLHVKLDGTLQSMTAGTTFTLEDVKPGSHVVLVEFVASDHAPFDPRVFAAATFRVE